MKKIIFSITVFACFIALMASMVLPIAANTAESETVEYDSTEAEQLDVTDSYYYDRIPERAQWCYNWLKDYYDNFSDEPGEYRFDITHLLPDGATEDDYSELFTDFVIGDAALKADQPLYEWKGRVSGSGPDTTGETNGVPGKFAFLMWITHSNILTEDAKQQTDARIQQIAETVGEGDRYTKLYKLTHYLINNSFYDPYLDQINMEGNDAYALATRGNFYNASAYGYLLKNIAICDAYADTVKVLCDVLDIPCIIIGNKAHAWNLVQMEDGSWYPHDLTRVCRLGWDDDPTYTFEEYFGDVFLNSDNTFGVNYGDPYMISVPYREPIRDFPELAKGRYEYTGDTTDFSYTVADSTYDPKNGVFSYSINNDGKSCTITNFEGKQGGDLIIPEMLDGYIVTAIEDFAFYYCTGFDGKLIIPDTVEMIGKAAFTGCYNLTSVELPDNLRNIGIGAFMGCKGMNSIDLPDVLNGIDKYAFYDCDGLNTANFGRHILSVAEASFENIDAEFIIKAPTDSVAQKYALENGIAFETNGSLCSFVDVDGDWEFNDNGHFHTCEHGGRFDIDAHTNQSDYWNCGSICSVCNAQKCLQIEGFRESTEVCVNPRPATCNEPAYSGDIWCMCGVQLLRFGEYVGEPTGQHTPATEEWEYDDVYHWQMCECGTGFQDGVHYGGTATETQRAICEGCGAEYGELFHVHSSFTMGYDEYSHFQMCSCGELFEFEPHYGGTATADELAICFVCGVAYGDYADHVHAAITMEYDENNHFQICSCGAAFNFEPHYGGVATEYELALCEACGVAYGDFAEHVHAAIDMGHYEDKHFNICSCGLWMDEENHYGGVATTTELAVCVVCGVAYGEYAVDSPENNTEAPENNTEAPENNTEPPENNTEKPEENNTEKPEDNTSENNTGDYENDTDASGGNTKDPDSNNSAINAGLAGGCGSSVGIGLMSLVTALAAGYVILKNKKDN